MSRYRSTSVYVGNLPSDIREREVDDLFYKFGDIIRIEIKTKDRSSCYAFIEFKRERDAAAAVHERQGYKFDGYRLKVEFARGRIGSTSTARNCCMGPSYVGVSYHPEFQVLVTQLPSSTSAEELKLHMEQAADVSFSEVTIGTVGIVEYKENEDRKFSYHIADLEIVFVTFDPPLTKAFMFCDADSTIGIVEYKDKEGMEDAAQKLHYSEFINQYWRGYINVKQHNGEYSPPYPRAASPSLSPSPRSSTSPRHDHGYPRHRSKSPRARNGSASRSRLGSNSPSASRNISHPFQPLPSFEDRGLLWNSVD